MNIDDDIKNQILDLIARQINRKEKYIRMNRDPYLSNSILIKSQSKLWELYKYVQKDLSE